MSVSAVKMQMTDESVCSLPVCCHQGLTTQVGGDLYEELCDYAQPEGTEAPWE